MTKLLYAPFIVAVVLATSVNAMAECPTCAKDKLENGWCDHCKVGFFDGIAMKSKKLFDALNGKPVANADEIKCPGCKAAYEENGTCEHCKVEFANHRMYKSECAYRLALGTQKNPANMKCSECKSYIGEHGWCDQCKQGIVGMCAFHDKEAYNKAVEARELIQCAAKAAEKCEGCAVAMVTDGTCDHCKVSFKDGKMVKNDEKKAGDKP